jgi:hypothetical protein
MMVETAARGRERREMSRMEGTWGSGVGVLYDTKYITTLNAVNCQLSPDSRQTKDPFTDPRADR